MNLLAQDFDNIELFWAEENASSSPVNRRFLDKARESILRFKYSTRDTLTERDLGKLFYSVHRKILKRYKNGTSFQDLVDRGQYNCVTGTALYALILDELGIAYQIFETSRHVFLMVKPGNDQELMFECTDPLDGFVTDPETMNQRLEHYLNEREPWEHSWVAGLKLMTITGKGFKNGITLENLAGLAHYNQAIGLYMRGDFLEAQKILIEALKLYPKSFRILSLYQLVTSHYLAEKREASPKD